MQQDFQISFTLDKRRKKNNNKYPVKLYVYNPVTQEQRYYPTKFDFTEDEFKSVWISQKPRKEHADDRNKLRALLYKANQAAEKLHPFNFDQFSKRLYRKTGEGNNVMYHYEEKIKFLKEHDQLSTASNYELSKKSLIRFITEIRRGSADYLSFYDITPEWLREYEYFMLNNKKSYTTISMYVRALQAVYNKAIQDSEVEKEYLPFGKGRYQIPAPKKAKKALTNNQLKTLFEAVPRTSEQEKAKDFWFFSYVCNGMNIKDIANLKWGDIKGRSFTFTRAKTMTTAKTNFRDISVLLTDFARGIIAKYGSKGKKSKNYIFDILSDNLDSAGKRRNIQNFTRFINQNLQKLAQTCDLPEEISTYWARHTFATKTIREGGSMEFVQKALGHSSMKVTQDYFHGFEGDQVQEIMNRLMEFGGQDEKSKGNGK